MIVLLRGGVEIARRPLAPAEVIDLETIDRLARWQLAAKRLGCSISLEGAGPGLVGLLRLVGLAAALGLADDLGPDELGQTEHREQIGVEEAVMADDPGS